MMHKTIRFPANRSAWTRNAVLIEHLKDHIEYNKSNRFGQSLFVDDVCVYQSFIHNDEDIKELTKMSKEIEMPEHSIPYR
jgi:hypothetical protein